jgi:alkaline phosphatase
VIITDLAGNQLDVVVENGVIVGDPNREIRIVTLGFLIDDPDNNGLGGDNYPFPTLLVPGSRQNLLDGVTPVGEQKALADYFLANFPDDTNPATPEFAVADTGPGADARIQNLAIRSDTVVNPTPVRLDTIGRLGGLTAAEISAYDPVSKRLYTTANLGGEQTWR